MNIQTQLVFDRTNIDIAQAQSIIEKYQNGDWSLITAQEVAKIERGTYTCTSLNRIEQATKDIWTLLMGYGYNVPKITVKTWSKTDYFTVSELERYLSNIAVLKSAYYTYQTTPALPDNYKPFNKANAIEKILYDISEIIDKMVKNFPAVNSFVCGNYDFNPAYLSSILIYRDLFTGKTVGELEGRNATWEQVLKGGWL